MQIGKRIFLFIAVNALVIITVSLLLNIFNVQPFMNAQGLNYESLMVFCLIWGMGGAFVSLALSRIMAKWMMGVQIIDPQTHSSRERELVQTVHRLARTAGLTTMPQVGIYESPEVNAFATGPTRNRALVAVSSGLLSKMDQRSVEGVLGHEIAHVANGDMVTMTLIQGVVNAFVMFLARVVAFAISNFLKGDRDGEGQGLSGIAYFLTVMVLEMVFMFLGSILVVMPFSRWREFRADAGGARLAGRENMIAALRSLQDLTDLNRRVAQQSGESRTQSAVASLKIEGGSAWMALLATHPSLETRIARLKSAPLN